MKKRNFGQSETNTLIELITRATKLRNACIPYKNMVDLLTLMYRECANKVDFLNLLLSTYSIGRTCNKNRKDELCETLENNKHYFDEYGKNGLNQQITDLFMVTKFSPSGKKKIVSLISKYMFYATDKQFPIYDSLAKNTLNKLQSKYAIGKRITTEPDFFAMHRALLYKIRAVNNSVTIDDLDAFLWLYGILSAKSQTKKSDTDNANNAPKRILNNDKYEIVYSSTLGAIYLRQDGTDTKYGKWYKDVSKFLDKNEK